MHADVIHDCLRLRQIIMGRDCGPNDRNNCELNCDCNTHAPATAVTDMVAHMHPATAVTICALPFETWRSAVVTATAANYRGVAGLTAKPVTEEE